MPSDYLQVLTKAIQVNQTGEHEVKLSSGICSVNWSPILVYSEASEFQGTIPPTEIYHAVAVKFLLVLETEEQTVKQTLASLINSIRAKIGNAFLMMSLMLSLLL